MGKKVSDWVTNLFITPCPQEGGVNPVCQSLDEMDRLGSPWPQLPDPPPWSTLEPDALNPNRISVLFKDQIVVYV